MSKNPRYDGKPLLRLIELYVIDAVGALTKDQEQSLEAMAPKLCETFGTSGDWRAAIASAMGFPTTMSDSIREMWIKNQEIAKENGTSLTAESFAAMFVDANIPQ
jgi:hypothetical protein